MKLGTTASGDRISLDLPATFTTRIKELPGSRFVKSAESWTFPRTYPAAVMLGSVAREIGAAVEADQGLKDWVAAEKKAWQELAAIGNVVLAPGGGTDRLYAHQVQDVEWLTYPHGPDYRLLLSDVGIGKTRAVVESIRVLGKFPALVVCPASVIVTGWIKEFAKTAPEIRLAVANGNITQRRKEIDRVAAGTADVLIIGYEAMRSHTRYRAFPGMALRRCEKCGGAKLSDEGSVPAEKCQAHDKELNQIPWAVCVSDESHRILNARSQTKQALGGITRSAGESLVWEMTATPTSKKSKVDRLWSLLNWLDPESWSVKGAWTDRYCVSGWDRSGYPEIKGWNPDHLGEIHTVLDAVSRRVLVDQALDLPKTLRGGSLIRRVEMGSEQGRVYREMRDRMLAEVDEGIITAANVANKTQRLAALAGAVGIPGPDQSIMGLRLPSCKFDELVGLIEGGDLGDQYALAFTSRKLLRVFTEALTGKGILAEVGIIDGLTPQHEKDMTIIRFQGEQLECCAFTHAAGGVGIDLYAAETLVMVERPWSGWQETQSLGRVRRAGMKPRPVKVIDIITRGTVEQRQLESLGEDHVVLEELVQDKKRMKDFLMGELK